MNFTSIVLPEIFYGTLDLLEERNHDHEKYRYLNDPFLVLEISDQKKRQEIFDKYLAESFVINGGYLTTIILEGDQLLEMRASEIYMPEIYFHGILASSEMELYYSRLVEFDKWHLFNTIVENILDVNILNPESRLNKYIAEIKYFMIQARNVKKGARNLSMASMESFSSGIWFLTSNIEMVLSDLVFELQMVLGDFFITKFSSSIDFTIKTFEGIERENGLLARANSDLVQKLEKKIDEARIELVEKSQSDSFEITDLIMLGKYWVNTIQLERELQFELNIPGSFSRKYFQLISEIENSIFFKWKEVLEYTDAFRIEGPDPFDLILEGKSQPTKDSEPRDKSEDLDSLFLHEDEQAIVINHNLLNQLFLKECKAVEVEVEEKYWQVEMLEILDLEQAKNFYFKDFQSEMLIHLSYPRKFERSIDALRQKIEGMRNLDKNSSLEDSYRFFSTLSVHELSFLFHLLFNSNAQIFKNQEEDSVLIRFIQEHFITKGTTQIKSNKVIEYMKEENINPKIAKTLIKIIENLKNELEIIMKKNLI